MKYDFKEAQLPDDFRQELVLEIKKKLQPSGFFILHGMPGVGISMFLRFLATREFADFIYLDTASLVHKTKHEFFVALHKELGDDFSGGDEQTILEKCKQKLKERAEHGDHVILLINRFDELAEIDNTLLGNLRTLRHVSTDRISILLVTHSPIIRDELSGGNLDVFSNVIYFRPYELSEIKRLYDLYASSAGLIQPELAGGNYQLTRLIQKSSRPSDLLSDVFIQRSLQKIASSLIYTQRKTVKNIALGKKILSVDSELLSTGIVKDNKNEYTVFSPLFAEYIIRSSRVTLSVKEALLFKLLKNNVGKVVPKEEIFRTLWREEEEEFATDWALNALIYRMRKNNSLQSKGYQIENYKKVGYMLVRE